MKFPRLRFVSFLISLFHYRCKTVVSLFRSSLSFFPVFDESVGFSSFHITGGQNREDLLFTSSWDVDANCELEATG